MSIISSFGSSWQPTAPGPAPAQTGGGAEQLVATTGPGGFALVNGTPVIIQWQAPNDGVLHRVTIKIAKNTGSAETGGQINLQGTNIIPQAMIGQIALVGFTPNGRSFVVVPGTLVQITQGTALTAGGPSTVYAEIWAS